MAKALRMVFASIAMTSVARDAGLTQQPVRSVMMDSTWLMDSANNVIQISCVQNVIHKEYVWNALIDTWLLMENVWPVPEIEHAPDVIAQNAYNALMVITWISMDIASDVPTPWQTVKNAILVLTALVVKKMWQHYTTENAYAIKIKTGWRLQTNKIKDFVNVPIM